MAQQSAWIALLSESPNEALAACQNPWIPNEIINGMFVIQRNRLMIYMNKVGKVQDGEEVDTGDANYPGINLKDVGRHEVARQNRANVDAMPASDKATMEKFIVCSSSRFGSETAKIEKQKKVIDEQVSQLNQQLLAAMKDQVAIDAQITELEEGGVKVLHQEDLALEYMSMKKSPQVDTIDFVGEGDDAKLVVTTKMIYNNNRHNDFGKFKIIVDLSPRGARGDHYGNNKIKIEPIEIVGSHDHYNPGYKVHSEYSNGFCFGTYGDQMLEALKRYQFGMVVAIANRFLEYGDEPGAKGEA